jgi:hypothetical protein
VLAEADASFEIAFGAQSLLILASLALNPVVARMLALLLLLAGILPGFEPAHLTTLRLPIGKCVSIGTPETLPFISLDTCAFEQRSSIATSFRANHRPLWSCPSFVASHCERHLREKM